MSEAIVQSVKADLVARGVDLSGPCGAFQITKRVAWALRNQGYGLLSKPGGNNCEGYSVDYVVHSSGQGYDMLGDAGGANTPGWSAADTFPPDRIRPAVDPGDAIAPPVPAAPSALTLEQAVAQINAHTDAKIEEVKQQIDQVVKNAEESAKKFAALAAGAGGGLSGIIAALGKGK